MGDVSDKRNDLAVEMLAVLEHLVFDCEAYGLDDNDAHLREARAVIAKAKGE